MTFLKVSQIVVRWLFVHSSVGVLAAIFICSAPNRVVSLMELSLAENDGRNLPVSPAALLKQSLNCCVSKLVIRPVASWRSFRMCNCTYAESDNIVRNPTATGGFMISIYKENTRLSTDSIASFLSFSSIFLSLDGWTSQSPAFGDHLVKPLKSLRRLNNAVCTSYYWKQWRDSQWNH